MKIFSSFDTDLDQKIYKQFIEKYSKEKVIMIYRDKLFFFIYVLLPLFLYIFFVSILLIFWYYYNFEWLLWVIIWWLIILIIIISLFMFWRWILKRYIDYKMDFAVVWPEEIVSYNQSGFFDITSRSLETWKIKTISVNKKWLFNSIFNYGTLIFLSEWDNKAGDIQLYYISHPEELRKRIKIIMDLADDKWE